MNTKKIPMRKCSGCGEMKPKKELIRVLKSQDESVEVDFTGRANGRGAYLCSNPACLEKAIKSKAIEKSLKIAIPQEIYEKLRESFE